MVEIFISLLQSRTLFLLLQTQYIRLTTKIMVGENQTLTDIEVEFDVGQFN